MKLLNPQGCQFPCGRGNEKELTMIVEVHGIGFWTRVRFPPGPLSRGAAVIRCSPFFREFSAFLFLTLCKMVAKIPLTPKSGWTHPAFLPAPAGAGAGRRAHSEIPPRPLCPVGLHSSGFAYFKAHLPGVESLSSLSVREVPPPKG